MSEFDLSANKCYPLDMPNINKGDSRLRLDQRTGASINISNSRVFVFGGCTLELDLPIDFTIEIVYNAFIKALKTVNTNTSNNGNDDYNNYLSSECFRLSLINRKWNHYNIASSTSSVSEKPEPRMFHNMSIYDNYIFIAGGLKFNEKNKLEILNDLWRFDTIDKNWKCYYSNGNNKINKRFDHLSTVLTNMEFFDKSLVHPGICIAGGLDEKGNYVNELEVFDVLDDDLKVFKYPNFVVFQNLDGEVGNGVLLNLRQSKNTIYSSSCPISNQLKIFAYDLSPDPKTLEPLIIFNECIKGVRIPHKSDFDNTDISNMNNVTIGTFGENLILVGCVDNEKKLSSYVYNMRTSAWTKLQICCMHKLFTHKLTKGFVWESHHKAAFLGSITKKISPNSVMYFDSVVFLSLPFTNFYGKKPLIPQQKNRFSTTSSYSSLSNLKNFNERSTTIPNDLRKRSNSITSSNSNLSHPRIIQQPSYEHTGGFAGYSYHVAQQLQVNSIRSVLPAYAIAIGKNAFERNTSFSDFDLVCSDGTIIPVPLVLCRRRWGNGFDQIFAGAYAKSYVEGKAYDIISSKGSTYDSNESVDVDEYSSINSKNSLSAPYFRYPFQEKEANHKHDFSPMRNTQNKVISGNNSRHSSVSGSLFPASSLNRALLSLSQSRRNSHNTQSRHNSISYFPRSRRNSLNINLSSPRRNSTNVLQVAQANSRRNSALSRNSFTSSSSSSNNSSIPMSIPIIKSNNHISPQSSSNISTSLSPPLTGRNHYNEFSSSIGPMDKVDPNYSCSLSSSDNFLSPNVLNSIKLDSIPPQAPMPNVLPNGQPMEKRISNYIDSSSRTLSHVSNPDDTFSKRNSSGITNLFDDELVNIVYSSDAQIEALNKFNPLRIPRSLYLPYSKNTVKAIVEFMYSGQIGANWKLFPTGIELLIATKQLNIPLLYDLVLELFFVVLSIIEASLKAKLILYIESHSTEINDNDNNNDNTFDQLYNLLDVKKGKDELDMDLELLLEAADNSRRFSGSTIDSELKIDDINEEYEFDKNLKNDQNNNDSQSCRKGSQVNGVDPLDVGPVDKIGSPLSACELSPTNTQFDELSDLEDNDDIVNDNKGSLKNANDVIKITTAALDENGYEITDDSEEDDDTGFLINSFKKFSMDNTTNNNEKSLDKDKGKKRTKLKEWPTFKDMLNDENTENVSEIFIELFIETGALINDSKLMLEAIHIQKLLNKVDSLNEKTDEKGVTDKNDLKSKLKTNDDNKNNIEKGVTLRRNNNNNFDISLNKNKSIDENINDNSQGELIDLSSELITDKFSKSLFNLAGIAAAAVSSSATSTTGAMAGSGSVSIRSSPYIGSTTSAGSINSNENTSINNNNNNINTNKNNGYKPIIMQKAKSEIGLLNNNKPLSISRKNIKNLTSGTTTNSSSNTSIVSRDNSNIDERLFSNWKNKYSSLSSSPIPSTEVTVMNAHSLLPIQTGSSMKSNNNSNRSLMTNYSGSSESGNENKSIKGYKGKKKGFFSRFKH